MIITLTTDFGLHDPFVGIMKGVILGIAPGAQIVDISHDIHSYDVLEGAPKGPFTSLSSILAWDRPEGR